MENLPVILFHPLVERKTIKTKEGKEAEEDIDIHNNDKDSIQKKTATTRIG